MIKTLFKTLHPTILLSFVLLLGFCHKPKNGKYNADLTIDGVKQSFYIRLSTVSDKIQITQNIKLNSIFSNPCSGLLKKSGKNVSGVIRYQTTGFLTGVKNYAYQVDGKIKKENFGTYNIEGTCVDSASGKPCGEFKIYPRHDYIK